MEQLSLSSFLRHGHRVRLFVYGDVKGVPAGVIVEDGNQVLPESMLFTYAEHPSYSGFSNFFRYKLLLEQGGWWVDTDMVCLQPFEFADEYVFSSEFHPDGSQQVNVGAIKAPAGSPLMEHLWRRCQAMDTGKLQWGECGPRLLAEALPRMSVTGRVTPPAVFCPVDFMDWHRVLDPEAGLGFSPETYGVHLWNEMWRRAGADKDARYPPGCLYERLKAQYLPTRQVATSHVAAMEGPAIAGRTDRSLEVGDIGTSAVVLSKNGESRLACCLESIRRSGFVDEIVVCIDDTTSDNSAAIARQFTDQIHFLRTKGYIESVLGKMAALCRGKWILRIDDDETLEGQWDPAEIRARLAAADATHAWVPRRWLSGAGDAFIASAPWFPDLQLRLVRNLPEIVKCPIAIHEPLEVIGNSITLADGWIDHHVLVIADRQEREAKCREYQRLRPEKHLSHFYLYEDQELLFLPSATQDYSEALRLALPSNLGIQKSAAGLYEVGQVLQFGLAGNARAYTSEGWSTPEEWGMWTDGFRAVIALPLRELGRGGLRLITETNAHIGRRNPTLRVCIVCGHQVVGEWSIAQPGFEARAVDIPMSALRENHVTISFHVINPMSPFECGESGDRRRLGLGFRSMRLESGNARSSAAAPESALAVSTSS